MLLHPIPSPPVRGPPQLKESMFNPPPPLIQLKESKFDQASSIMYVICVCSVYPQLLGEDEGEFTDKILESDLPEDWGDNMLEMFDENGWNLLHYSILKGFSTTVQVLVEDLDENFGKSLFLHITLFIELKQSSGIQTAKHLIKRI